MKNQVTALLVMIGAAWIVEPLASLGLSFVSWGSKVVPYLPSAATSAIVNQPSQSPTVHQLSQGRRAGPHRVRRGADDPRPDPRAALGRQLREIPQRQ